MPKKKEKETVEELVIPTELLEKDPIELADNEMILRLSSVI